jgi:23S rRNA (uracil1939-C5)-methyltransferase
VRVGEQYDVAFTDLLGNGQAVGRVNGAVVFCFGPLPSETARVTIVGVKPKYAVAELHRLLTESPFRVKPFCPVFGKCGGCQVQHLNYQAQLEWKREVVRNALARIGGFAEVDLRDTVGMAVPREYRNKMSLVVDRRPGYRLPAIGFYRQRSHVVVPIEGCPVVSPQLSGYVARFNAAASSMPVAALFREARHVVARSARASGEAVVTVTTQRESKAARAGAAALLAQLPGAVGVTNSYDLSSENAILGRRQRVVAGRAEIEETIGGTAYRVSAGSFFQVNVEIVERIFEVLESWIRGRALRVVDLYSGAGTFALFFAKHGCNVVGIEENSRAVAEARSNAARNGLQDKLEFHAQRVEEALRRQEGRPGLASADAVFLDPPRKGSDETTLGAIATAGVPAVWYLSCDPATLARDLKFLAAKGYRLGSVRPFDMFPQTGHVECLAALELPSKK